MYFVVNVWVKGKSWILYIDMKFGIYCFGFVFFKGLLFIMYFGNLIIFFFLKRFLFLRFGIMGFWVGYVGERIILMIGVFDYWGYFKIIS